MESVPRADGSVGTDSGTGSAGNHLEPPARVVSIMSLGIASACDEYQSLGAASALLHRYQCVAVTDDYQVLCQRQSPKISRLWDGSEWVHRVYLFFFYLTQDLLYKYMLRFILFTEYKYHISIHMKIQI